MNRLAAASVASLAVSVFLHAVALHADEPTAAGLAFGEGKLVAKLEDSAVHESSGIAASCSIQGAFWTHNDSGDEPRLFLLDAKGAALGRFAVEGAKARDWEDIASFEHGGKPWILVADTGDNGSKREHVTLYLIEEPSALPKADEPGTLRVRRALRVRWDGGPIDCEGVGVDVPSGQILLVTKVRKSNDAPTVHVLALDALVGSSETRDALETKKIATLETVPRLTTGLDVAPDGRRLVVCTYGDAYAWSRGADETWGRALAKPPARIALPRREQGEAICFGRDGRSLFLTSEGSPCPLFELAPR